MDARPHWRVRIKTMAAATTLIVVVLWVADFRVVRFDLSRSWQKVRDWWAQDWFPEKDERYAIAPQLPTPVTMSDAQAVEGVKPLMGTDSSISKVPLPLILVRTEPGRDAREGRALLGVARENPQTYASGALLANGACITEVHADHVVLRRDGESVNLYVDGSKRNAKPLNDLLTVGGHPEVKWAVATSHEILTDYLRLSPVYDGDRIKGYQVYAGQRSAVFSQMGLQGGDVITSINDMPFSDPQQAMSLFKQLTDGMAVVVNVERQGKVDRISVDGALITADQERIENPPPQLAMPIGPGA